MDTVPATRAPAHLWIVGLVSLLWNGFGAYDYVMSRTGNLAYFESIAPSREAAQEMLAMIEGFPLWMGIFWALGVWGSVAGSVLLLMRSRFAVHAFAVSLLGMVVGMVYQMTVEIPEWATEGAMAIMPYVILLIGVGLLFYARAMDKRGVLR